MPGSATTPGQTDARDYVYDLNIFLRGVAVDVPRLRHLLWSGSVDHEWLLQMVAHRIADPRILQLIKLWLRAGILESGETYETDKGTPPELALVV
ncbi:hypothetical protein [Sinorhizobium meliloti]|uniref:hypothetical protein n=1 Tax=Rhizobium meliloti TaxID=382 RepID=UPI001F233AD2|nr:hypothetical protein [Sinorhizobium meliloti]